MMKKKIMKMKQKKKMPKFIMKKKMNMKIKEL